MDKQAFQEWCAAVPSDRSPLIMGILNATPDSFSDGGSHLSVERAYQRVVDMVSQGADLIDVGGVSTRPGAQPVSVQEELDRVLPIIEAIQNTTDHCISIDTYKPKVMAEAVKAGAGCINDIYALQKPGALDMARQLSVPICLMHMQGTPITMQREPSYPEGVMTTIHSFFEQRLSACRDAGIPLSNIILDPGFGFGKKVEHNLTILKNCAALKRHNLPLLIGVSRKSTIGAVLDKPVNERMIGGLVSAIYAALQGVGIIRTHNVDETKQAWDMMHAINTACDV